MKKLIVLAVLCSVLTAGAAAAKEGFYLGGGLVHNNPLSSDVDFMRSAIGLDLRLGYNFGPAALEINLIGSTHDDDRAGIRETRFGSFSIDARIPFTSKERQNHVYVLVGFSGNSLQYTDPAIGDVKYSGGGMELGLGTERFFNEHLAFNLAAVYRAIKYDEREAQGLKTEVKPRLDGDMMSIEAGLNYHF